MFYIPLLWSGNLSFLVQYGDYLIRNIFYIIKYWKINKYWKISFRLTTFQENWPKLEKWFNKFQNVLQLTNADVSQGNNKILLPFSTPPSIFKRLSQLLRLPTLPSDNPSLSVPSTSPRPRCHLHFRASLKLSLKSLYFKYVIFFKTISLRNWQRPSKKPCIK